MYMVYIAIIFAIGVFLGEKTINASGCKVGKTTRVVIDFLFGIIGWLFILFGVVCYPVVWVRSKRKRRNQQF